MMQIEECIKRLTEKISTIERQEEVGLAECVGRVLAEDVKADISVPHFNRSAMDGYAVKAEETQGIAGKAFQVAGKILAGDYAELLWSPHTAVRVMTGAYIPPGYDAVVKQEDTDMGESRVRIFKAVKPGENYCPEGEDIRMGETVLEAGTLLSHIDCGLLASIGKDKVKVVRRPKIAIISTGSELVEPGRELEPGKIYASVGAVIAGICIAQGMEVIGPELCGDDQETAEKMIREALCTSDMVITTGAVSVGEKDFIPALLSNMGGEILFKGADIQPGTPTMASFIGGRVILSLSGNPYAALANFELYFWEAMAKMTGCAAMRPKACMALLADPYHKVNKHRRLIRARAEGGKVYLPAAAHQSSVIKNMRECNCFIDLEAGRQVKAGDKVRIRYIKGL